MVDCKTQDYLHVDAERRGQKFVVLSVLNPEATLADRRVFEFGKFMRSVGADVNALLDSIVENSRDGDAGPVDDTVRMIRERYAYLWTDEAMQDEMRFYSRAHRTQLTEDFDKQHDFATSIRGINVRGVCESLSEAHSLVDELKQVDTTHSMFIGNVGYWLPIGVHPDDVKDNEYAHTQLNTLMKKYTEAQAENEVRYMMRTTDLKARVAADNACKVAADKVAKAAENSATQDTPTDQLRRFEGDEDAWTAGKDHSALNKLMA